MRSKNNPVTWLPLDSVQFGYIAYHNHHGSFNVFIPNNSESVGGRLELGHEQMIELHEKIGSALQDIRVLRAPGATFGEGHFFGGSD